MIPIGTKVWSRDDTICGWVVGYERGTYLLDVPAGWGRRILVVRPESDVHVAHTLRNYLRGLYEEP